MRLADVELRNGDTLVTTEGEVVAVIRADERQGAGLVTARRIVEDLEELALTGAIDAIAVRMVREGLLAIAGEVRDLARSWPGLIDKVALLELVDPEHGLR